MHHIWKKFAGAGAAAAAALALSLLAAPVSADTAAEIVTAPPVATATTQPDDTQHSGWETIDGKRYYYDPETGEMQTGWLVLTNGSISRRYFFGEDGAVMTGFPNRRKYQPGLLCRRRGRCCKRRHSHH